MFLRNRSLVPGSSFPVAVLTPDSADQPRLIILKGDVNLKRSDVLTLNREPGPSERIHFYWPRLIIWKVSATPTALSQPAMITEFCPSQAATGIFAVNRDVSAQYVRVNMKNI